MECAARKLNMPPEDIPEFHTTRVCDIAPLAIEVLIAREFHQPQKVFTDFFLRVPESMRDELKLLEPLMDASPVDAERCNNKYLAVMLKKRHHLFPASCMSYDLLSGEDARVRNVGLPVRKRGSITVHSGSTPCTGVSARNTSGLRGQASPVARVTGAWLSERIVCMETQEEDFGFHECTERFDQAFNFASLQAVCRVRSLICGPTGIAAFRERSNSFWLFFALFRKRFKHKPSRKHKQTRVEHINITTWHSARWAWCGSDNHDTEFKNLFARSTIVTGRVWCIDSTENIQVSIVKSTFVQELSGQHYKRQSNSYYKHRTMKDIVLSIIVLSRIVFTASSNYTNNVLSIIVFTAL